MKLSVALALASAASVAAFAPSSKKAASSSALQMSNMPAQNEMRGYYTNLEQRNAELDVDSLPGIEFSTPFDPFKFSETNSGLFFMRESEIKHCRLAMLAAAGWPLAELADGKLAGLFGLDPVVDATARNPNVLNGGLDKVNPLYWIAILGAASVIDIYQIQKANSGDKDYFPGNLGFDPLGLYPQDKKGRLEMQAKEIRNGRLAMIAVSAFVAQEFVQGNGIVEHSSMFFKPAFL